MIPQVFKILLPFIGEIDKTDIWIVICKTDVVKLNRVEVRLGLIFQLTC